MRRVPLHHDRTAGSQRRGGVSTGDGEGEREVRGAEHRDRPHRNLAQADGRTRKRLALGERAVDADAQPVARSHQRGEQAQLPAGPAPLALQTCARQAALRHRPLDQRVAKRLDIVGNRLEEARAGLRIGLTIGVEGGNGQLAGPPHFGRADAGKFRRDQLAAGRIDRAEQVAAPHRFAPD